MKTERRLKVVHAHQVSVDVRMARGCISAQLNKGSDVCMIDARVIPLEATDELVKMIDRFGELLSAAFPDSMKATTFGKDSFVLATRVQVDSSSTKGGPDKQIKVIQEMLEAAGFTGVLIGSVIINKKKKKIH